MLPALAATGSRDPIETARHAEQRIDIFGIGAATGNPFDGHADAFFHGSDERFSFFPGEPGILAIGNHLESVFVVDDDGRDRSLAIGVSDGNGWLKPFIGAFPMGDKEANIAAFDISGLGTLRGRMKIADDPAFFADLGGFPELKGAQTLRDCLCSGGGGDKNAPDEDGKDLPASLS